MNDAIEIDIDVICDGKEVLIGGIMEHIEQAGVHSGDSACSLPPYSLSADIQEQIKDQARQLALELKVVGLMNALFAVQAGSRNSASLVSLTRSANPLASNGPRTKM